MRGLVIASPKLDEAWRAVVAAEMYKDNGPFANPEKLTRFNLFGRVTHDLGPRSKVALTWMSYGSRWNGSGQIPARLSIQKDPAVQAEIKRRAEDIAAKAIN